MSPSSSSADELSTASHWDAIDRATICSLITSQIPKFAERPYLADAGAFRAAIRGGLEHRVAGDFCWSLCFDPAFIAALCFEGFLPICTELGGGTGLFVLLPKLHVKRCLLDFERVHASRKTRRAARRYTMTIGTAFDDVIQGCIDQHGADWLYPPICEAYSALAKAPSLDDCSTPRLISFELWADSAPTSNRAPVASAQGGVASDMPASAERQRRLAAGEFGVVVGQSYLSISGFHREGSAGSVQLHLTAQALRLAGFAYWDLGQEHEYKIRLGGQLFPRSAFLTRFRHARSRRNQLGELLERCDHQITQQRLAELSEATTART